MNKILDQIISSGEQLAVRALGTYCVSGADQRGGYHEYKWRGRTYYLPVRGGNPDMYKIGEFKQIAASAIVPNAYYTHVVQVSPDGYVSTWLASPGAAQRTIDAMNLDRKHPIAEPMDSHEARMYYDSITHQRKLT